MNSTIQDIRYALRQLRKSPGFGLTVIVTLALSVGAATAVFCVLDGVVLRPLPFANPDSIINFDTHSGSGYMQPASWPSYKDERAQATSFKALAGYFKWRDVAVVAPNGPAVLPAVNTSDNFFDVFGVHPLLGRTFLPGEQEAGRNDVVVLGYDTWMKEFGGAPSAIGSPLSIDGRVYTVIGVMPAGFRFPLNLRDGVYIPLHTNAAQWMQSRGGHCLRTIGRLKDGVTLSQAQADVTHIFAGLTKAYPDTDGGRTVRLQLLSDAQSSDTRGALWTLLGAVFAVLAIGCVNIAGLLLARGVKREREMAMRVAIGAGKMRLLRQMFTEGLLLALMGSAAGVALAAGMLDIMRAFLIKALERGAEIHLNVAVLSASVAVAVLVSLAATLYPALRLSGIDPNRALRAGGSAGTGRGEHRVRAGFVMTQVALTLVLLVVAGMLIRSVTRYRHVDLGYDPSHVLTGYLHIAPVRYEGRDVLSGFFQPLLDRVKAIPGVRAAGLIDMLPIDSWGSNSDVHITGQPPYQANKEMLAENRMVTSGYFDVFGIPLRQGRGFSPMLDLPGNKAATVVVNEAFAKKFSLSPLAASSPHIDDHEKTEEKTAIVGVAGNVRQDIREEPLAEMDYVLDEVPVMDRAAAMSSMVLVVRTDGDAKAILPALRAALHNLDPTVPLADARTMSEVISEQLAFERMEGWLFGTFASLALVLALVGLYGLVAHEVEQSTRDIGVRMALGATRNRILGMVMRRVAWMLGAGAVGGLALTFAARKVIGVVIFFDAQKEAGEIALVALALIAAGLVAALIPAARAASIEPMQALRSE
jgi:predicted permease